MDTKIRKLGLGIALSYMLSAGCAVAVKYHPAYEKDIKLPCNYQIEVKARIPKGAEIDYKILPKEADKNLDYVIDKEEARAYISGKFRREKE
jgi:hypothetical protein